LDQTISVATAHADAVDREARFPKESLQALREAKCLGSLIPTHLGGLGQSLTAVAAHCQRLAQACASSAMVYAMHQSQVVCIVHHALHQPWHRDFAQRIAKEQLLLASITSEVGIGGDMRSSACAVEVADGRFTLVKEAPTISYGEYADALLVTTRAQADAPPSDQVLVTCLKQDSVLTPTNGWDAVGMRGTCSGGFHFEGKGVADQVIPANFADIAADTMVPVSHLLWSSVWTGIAAEALTRARAFLREQARRKPGSTPPGAARLTVAAGKMTLMQERLASMLASYDACHNVSTGHQAVSAEEAGWPSGLARATALNTLKIDLSQMCYEVVLEAMLICGMAGYKNGTPFSVGRHLRDILSAQLMISNDRIAGSTGSLLLAQRNEIGTLSEAEKRWNSKTAFATT